MIVLWSEKQRCEVVAMRYQRRSLTIAFFMSFLESHSTHADCYRKFGFWISGTLDIVDRSKAIALINIFFKYQKRC